MKYNISIVEQICMSLRRTPVGKIKRELKKAEQHKLDLNGQSLEAHFLSSGDISDLTDSMIFAQENGIKLGQRRAAICQLAVQTQGGALLLNKLQEMKAKNTVDIETFLWGSSNKAG